MTSYLSAYNKELYFQKQRMLALFKGCGLNLYEHRISNGLQVRGTDVTS